MPHATVHLLRHGEVHNPDGVLYGRLPEFHLSERGRDMARMLAEHFTARAGNGAKIVHLVASPLTRAQETAMPTAEALGLEITTDPRIIEAETEVLSDDTLVELLKDQGFDLARRTVAKYREAMGIGSSIQRRRQRKMAGG